MRHAVLREPSVDERNPERRLVPPGSGHLAVKRFENRVRAFALLRLTVRAGEEERRLEAVRCPVAGDGEVLERSVEIPEPKAGHSAAEVGLEKEAEVGLAVSSADAHEAIEGFKGGLPIGGDPQVLLPDGATRLQP